MRATSDGRPFLRLWENNFEYRLSSQIVGFSRILYHASMKNTVITNHLGKV